MKLIQTPQVSNNHELQTQLRQKTEQKFELIEDIFKKTKEDAYEILLPELTELFLKENFELDEVKIKKGLEFSIESHLGQYRDSGLPYAVHPVQTAYLVTMWDRSEEEIISALGHDSIEENEKNQNQIYEKIETLFGTKIRTNINTLTTLEEDRELRDKTHRRKLINSVKKTGDLGALFVFCADKTNNLYSGKDMMPKNGLTAKQRQKIYAEGILSQVLPIAKYLDRQNLTEYKINNAMNYFAKKLTN